MKKHELSKWDVVGTEMCPWCGRRTVYARDGIFRWKKCPAGKSCGWDVFKAGHTKQEWAAL